MLLFCHMGKAVSIFTSSSWPAVNTCHIHFPLMLGIVPRALSWPTSKTLSSILSYIPNPIMYCLTSIIPRDYISSINLKSTKPYKKEFLELQTLFLRTKACNSYDYFWHYFSDILRSSKGKLGNKAITRILIPCSLIIFQRLNLMIYGSCTFPFKWILAILYVCRGWTEKWTKCQLWSKSALILCHCDSAASVLLKCRMRHT